MIEILALSSKYLLVGLLSQNLTKAKRRKMIQPVTPLSRNPQKVDKSNELKIKSLSDTNKNIGFNPTVQNSGMKKTQIKTRKEKGRIIFQFINKQQGITQNFNHIQSQIVKDYSPQINNLFLKTNINCFFENYKKTNLSFSKLNYFNSLIPNIRSLKQTQTLSIKISKLFKRQKTLISHQNDVNTHLFKPFYSLQNGHLQCYVSSQDVLKHTINALFNMCNYYKIKIEKLRINYANVSIRDLISSWKLKQNIIICRIESLVTFLLIEWLHAKNIKKQIIKNIIVTLQNSRLIKDDKSFYQKIQNLLKQHLFSKRQFLDYFSIVRQATESIFIYGINFTYRNSSITAVMLPWGVQTAEELTEALYFHNPNIKKLGMVGGVGYIGNQHVKVDDIFIPDSLLIKEQDQIKLIQLDCPLNKYQNKIFNGFKVAKGCVKTVIPQYGQSFMQKNRHIMHEIDAFDMEFQVIFKIVDKYQKSTFASIFYIMDLPKKNIHLGDTYYRKDFLQLLFSKYKRGKNYCFEKLLLFLSSNQ